MMKRKSIAAILLSLMLILALSFAGFATEGEISPEGSTESVSGESAAKSEEAEESKESEDPSIDIEDAIRQEKPTGFMGLVNGYITLCEKGGLVTKFFGTWDEAVAEGMDGKLYIVETAELPAVGYPVALIICFVLSYFIGSVNFGVVVSKKMCNDDVRNHGSGNAGMTNVMRVHGKKAAIITFVGDAGKAALAALIGLMVAGNGCGYFALAGCMIGHAFPCFFKFKGGKGVSSLAGGMLILEPVAALLLIVLFAAIVLVTKYVSLGSVIAGCLLPVFVDSAWKISPIHNMGNPDSPIVMICAVFFAVGLVWLHRANIKRLLNREERKTDLIRDLFKKKKTEKN